MRDRFEIWGTYTTGCGSARKVVEKSPRSDMIAAILGTHVVGTFNLKVTKKVANIGFATTKPRHGFWYHKGRIIPMGYYLGRLTHQYKESVMVWVLSWHPFVATKHNAKCASIEIVSRRPIPDCFKDGSLLRLEMFSPWDKPAIDAWWPKQPFKWFQSFPWGPQRADGTKVWNAMYKWADWSKSTVLDVGCNTGWYSFQAAKHGSAVYGYDSVPERVRAATTIGEHIENIDVDFGAEDPGGNFDVILYLSVHHQIDKTYLDLADTLTRYKKRCKTIFLELIVPPPHNSMSPGAVKDIVGGEILLEYEHAVRCHRVLWLVPGELK
uniref:Putative methyltransferase n=1 Tax=viral metagenome TaxID=1070528 RepID=A0A6M3J0R7_9ZZZZ